MPAHNKSRLGCWTCRLRRKKCDGSHPPCRNCAALEIVCHHGLEKPGWMDGATKQREMMESIKNQIKRGASTRRENQALQRRRNGEITFVLHLERDNEGIR